MQQRSGMLKCYVAGGGGTFHALAATNQLLPDAKKLNTIKPDPSQQ